jgi:hypothetical protein
MPSASGNVLGSPVLHQALHYRKVTILSSQIEWGQTTLLGSHIYVRPFTNQILNFG